MSRFYKSTKAQFTPWGLPLPYDAIMKGLALRDIKQEGALKRADALAAYEQKIDPLAKDEAVAIEKMNWLRSNVDNLQGLDFTDPTNMDKLRSFSRDVAQEWSPTGEVGKINAEKKKKLAYDAMIDDSGELGMKEKAAYKAASYASYTGYKDGFKGINPVESVDIGEEWRERLSKYKLPQTKRTKVSIGDKYITQKDFHYTTEPRLDFAKMYSEFLSDPKIKRYIADGLEYGYLPKEGFNEEHLMFIQAHDKNGNPIFEKDGETPKIVDIQGNPNTYLGKVFEAGIKGIGGKIDFVTTDIKGNSTYNKSRSDDNISSSYFLDVLQRSKRMPQNISSMAPTDLFPNGKVNLENAVSMGEVLPDSDIKWQEVVEKNWENVNGHLFDSSPLKNRMGELAELSRLYIEQSDPKNLKAQRAYEKLETQLFADLNDNEKYKVKVLLEKNVEDKNTMMKTIEALSVGTSVASMEVLDDLVTSNGRSYVTGVVKVNESQIEDLETANKLHELYLGEPLVVETTDGMGVKVAVKIPVNADFVAEADANLTNSSDPKTREGRNNRQESIRLRQGFDDVANKVEQVMDKYKGWNEGMTTWTKDSAKMPIPKPGTPIKYNGSPLETPDGNKVVWTKEAIADVISFRNNYKKFIGTAPYNYSPVYNVYKAAKLDAEIGKNNLFLLKKL